MNSYTSARVYMGVPNALSLNQSELDAYYAGILAANVNWVRIPLPWNVIAATAPTVTTTTTWFFIWPRTTTTVTHNFTWTAADRAINRALAAGLNVQVVLAPPKPSWVVGKVLTTDFTPFAQAVANRYKPGGAGITVPGKFVSEYQVWDQPNVNTFWPTIPAQVQPTPPVPVSAAEYVKVLKDAHAAIKASHSGAVVVAAALQACKTTTQRMTPQSAIMVTTAQEPVAYLNAMYAAGAKGYFDIAAYNPLSLPTGQFPDPPAPSGLTMRQADAFYAALKAREPGKKVHWSSIGYHTPTVSLDQQAAYLDTLRWFAEERKAWVTGIGLAQWRDYAS